MKNIIIILLLIFGISAQADVSSVLATIPVQDSGRIKPFDTFSRETLQLIHGKKEYEGKPAVNIVMTWMLMPGLWDKINFIQIDNKDLKEKLGFDPNKRLFSPEEIAQNEKTELLIQDLKNKQENKEKLNVFYQAVLRLENQMITFRAIERGYIPGFVPSESSNNWIPRRDFSKEYAELFLQVGKAFSQAVHRPEMESELQAKVQLFKETIKGNFLDRYPEQNKINLEVMYNKIHPFQWAWILYFASAVLFLISFISQKNWVFKISALSAIVAFLFHTYGFILRIVIAGRPPVANMYETVIWVPWGTVLFSMIFLRVTKNRFFLFASSVISFFCLILADLAPAVLDASIQPLQPVLRSHLWLTAHVLTITISYGALFLSFVLADVALCFYLLGENKHSSLLSSLRDSIYRSVQVGIVLLGAGIILGGVWADYSWGRFWGWDPKETWALIAFLGYIAILHGRIAGWIKPFWFVFWNVLAFNLVVMAWYGVNYVLGAGLHSYGFGGGGVPFIATIVGLHLLFAITVWFVRTQRIKS